MKKRGHDTQAEAPSSVTLGAVVLAGLAAVGLMWLWAGLREKKPEPGISACPDTYSVAGEEDPGASVDAPVPPPRPPQTRTP